MLTLLTYLRNRAMARKKLSDEKKTSKTILLTAKRARQEAKRNAEKIYKQHVKELRPFMRKMHNVDLRKKLTSHQKSYITRAYQEFEILTSRPTKIYRTKNRKAIVTGKHMILV